MQKLFLFDFDDTLVRTLDRAVDAMIETAKVFYDLDIDKKHILKFWGLPFEEHMKSVFKNVDSVKNLQENYFKIRPKHKLEIHDGVFELFDKIKLDNNLLGLVSSASIEMIKKDLEDLNFKRDQLDIILSATDTEFHKPDPRVFNKVFEEFEDMKKENITYVGDNIRDFQAARDAGLEFYAVLTGVTTREEFLSEGLNESNILETIGEL